VYEQGRIVPIGNIGCRAEVASLMQMALLRHGNVGEAVGALSRRPYSAVVQ
jgi:hypothetical protein